MIRQIELSSVQQFLPPVLRNAHSTWQDRHSMPWFLTSWGRLGWCWLSHFWPNFSFGSSWNSIGSDQICNKVKNFFGSRTPTCPLKYYLPCPGRGLTTELQTWADDKNSSFYCATKTGGLHGSSNEEQPDLWFVLGYNSTKFGGQLCSFPVVSSKQHLTIFYFS